MERISRRQLLTTGGGAALIGAILAPRGAQAQADKDIASPWAMVVDVSVDPRSRDAVRTPAAGAAGPTGPVYEAGSIYRGGALTGGAAPSDAVRIGVFRAWGWMWDPARPLGGLGGAASFDIAGQGEIVLSGVADNRVAVTGGTGNFRGANGQADIARLGEGAFRVTFDITTNRVGPN